MSCITVFYAANQELKKFSLQAFIITRYYLLRIFIMRESNNAADTSHDKTFTAHYRDVNFELFLVGHSQYQ